MEPFNASPQALLHSKGLLADENNTHHYRTLWTTLNRCLPFKLLGICRRLAGEHINPEERENYLVVEEDLGVAMRERKRPPSCLDSGVHPYYAYVAFEYHSAADPARLLPVPC